jgi:hypothetical protein
MQMGAVALPAGTAVMAGKTSSPPMLSGLAAEEFQSQPTLPVLIAEKLQ